MSVESPASGMQRLGERAQRKRSMLHWPISRRSTSIPSVRRMQHHPGDIAFEQRVSIPEAEFLCCRYKGERFNVRFDLDFGVFVERVGVLSRQEIEAIIRWLTTT